MTYKNGDIFIGKVFKCHLKDYKGIMLSNDNTLLDRQWVNKPSNGTSYSHYEDYLKEKEN